MVFQFISFIDSAKRYSKHTILAYETDINQFLQYCAAEGTIDPLLIDRLLVRAYAMNLVKQGIAPRSIARKVVALRSFFKYLVEYQGMVKSPVAGLVVPKIVKRNPVFIQNVAQLPSPDLGDGSFLSLRDTIVLELLYGTGMRLSELLGLEPSSINYSSSYVTVLGKGNKCRNVPLHASLLGLLQQYIDALKLEFPTRSHDFLIVTDKGAPAYPMFIQRLLKRILLPSEVGVSVSPHILRHTFATHLLNEGAELQAIKELLGHASLQATQVYTHNSFMKLKLAYAKAHPRSGSET